MLPRNDRKPSLLNFPCRSASLFDSWMLLSVRFVASPRSSLCDYESKPSIGAAGRDRVRRLIESSEVGKFDGYSLPSDLVASTSFNRDKSKAYIPAVGKRFCTSWTVHVP